MYNYRNNCPIVMQSISVRSRVTEGGIEYTINTPDVHFKGVLYGPGMHYDTAIEHAKAMLTALSGRCNAIIMKAPNEAYGQVTYRTELPQGAQHMYFEEPVDDKSHNATELPAEVFRQLVLDLTVIATGSPCPRLRSSHHVPQLEVKIHETNLHVQIDDLKLICKKKDVAELLHQVSLLLSGFGHPEFSNGKITIELLGDESTPTIHVTSGSQHRWYQANKDMLKTFAGQLAEVDQLPVPEIKPSPNFKEMLDIVSPLPPPKASRSFYKYESKSKGKPKDKSKHETPKHWYNVD